MEILKRGQTLTCKAKDAASAPRSESLPDVQKG
jgi:hypothetical protein